MSIIFSRSPAALRPKPCFHEAHGVLYEHEGTGSQQLVRAAHSRIERMDVVQRRREGDRVEGAAVEVGPVGLPRGHAAGAGFGDRGPVRIERQHVAAFVEKRACNVTGAAADLEQRGLRRQVRAQGGHRVVRGDIDRLAQLAHGSSRIVLSKGRSRQLPSDAKRDSGSECGGRVASRADIECQRSPPTSRVSLTAAEMPTLVALVTDPPPHAA